MGNGSHVQAGSANLLVTAWFPAVCSSHTTAVRKRFEREVSRRGGASLGIGKSFVGADSGGISERDQRRENRQLRRE
jgi:hypothetical protein